MRVIYMKKTILIAIIELAIASIYYYIALPPINISSNDFWSFIIFLLAVLLVLITISNFAGNLKDIFVKRRIKDYSKSMIIIIAIILLIAHIFNIIVLKKMSNKAVNTTVLMILIIMVSVFIPVREINNERYDYSKKISKNNGISTMPLTRTVEYKNLYGITLKKKRETIMSVGPNIE